MSKKCKNCLSKNVEFLYNKGEDLRGILCEDCGFTPANSSSNRPHFDGQQISKGKRRNK